MGEINQGSPLSAKDRALLAEADHVIRKLDSLIADTKKFFEEQGWDKDEVSKVR